MVEEAPAARSISSESTYEHDLTDRDVIERETLRLCDQVAARLAESHVSGHTITLKVRFSDFSTINRSSRRAAPVVHTADIWNTAQGLLARSGIESRPVRLLGIAVSDLANARDARQLELGAERRSAAAQAVDEVRRRFGPASVIPARIAPESDVEPDQTRRDR
jgi:DNA polymerase-4